MDLETIGFFNYMTEEEKKKFEEQDRIEDEIFSKVMDIYMIEESKKIIKEMEERKGNK